MDKIEKIKDDLYIKKGWDGYRVVYPIKKDINLPWSLENTNWTNFFGQWHFWLKSIVILAIIYFVLQSYIHDTQECRDFIQNISLVCTQYMNSINQMQDPTYFPTEISSFNFSLNKDGETYKDT